LWESQYEQRKYVTDCHAHVHVPALAHSVIAFEKNFSNKNAGNVKKLEEAVDELKKRSCHHENRHNARNM
jgi:hypothetical protein